VKHSFKVGIGLGFVAILISSAFGGSVTGLWHGHVKVIVANLPTPPNPQDKARMMDQVNKNEKMVIGLTLKADHTFSITAPGMTASTPGQSGTWSQSGSTISMIAKGSGTAKVPPQVFTLAKDQKSFSMTQKNPMTKKDLFVITFSR